MSQNQKGFAPIILIVVAAVAILGGGYYLYSTGKIALPGTSGVRMLNLATEADFGSISDPILRKHFVAQSNVAAFRTKTSSSGKGTVDTAEYENKGNVFAFKLKSEDNGKEVSSMVSIGDTTYVKDYSDNSWWKQTAKEDKDSMEQEIADSEDIKDEFLKEDPALYKKVGEEACGDLMCYKYEQTFKDSPGTRTFWFDTKLHLLRKEISAYGEFSTEIVYSYDNVSVVAPSPTKDVPEGKNIYEYYIEGYSGGSSVNTNTQINTSSETPSTEETEVDYNQIMEQLQNSQEYEYPSE